jgi:tripartite-type tricarboxylate transporter receptor subunit TctC
MFASLTGSSAALDVYPSRSIRLIVGFSPGAASDIAARRFAEGAASVLGQQVVVENKPGAAGSIAAKYVTHAANDGYTVLLLALSTLTNELINPTPSFDVLDDLVAVAPLAVGTVVLVVNPASKVQSVADLVAMAKSKPGEVLYASTGAGSLPQFASEMFAQRTGIKLTAVPYPGSPQITEDLIAGRITMAFNIASGVIGQIKAGQLIGLATAAKRRARALPNVPTMAEAGIPDFDTSLWLGLAAPAGTPRPVVETLADAARRAMQSPAAVETLQLQGYEPFESGPDEFATFIRSEVDRWSAVARAAGLRT